MAKKLIAIIVLAMCVVFAAAACDGKHVTLSADNYAAASPEGGFLAETADYVYFINGSEDYTVDNVYGKVDKGTIVRVKKSELADGASAKKEVVVPKLVSTADRGAGIYIFNGRVYYATPSAVKSKTGVVQNGDVVLCSAKLDGSDVKEICTATGSDGNSTVFRFAEAGGKVYAYYFGDEEVDGSTVKYIYVYGEDGAQVAKEEYSEYIIDKANGYVFFTKSVKNEILDQTESFNEAYCLTIGAEKAVKVLYGAGSARNTQDGKTYTGKGVQGVTFALIASENGYVYYSVTNVDTSVSTNTVYAFSAINSLGEDAEANFANKTEMTYSGSATVFSANSFFVNPELIVYLDSSKGLCSYNYKKEDDYNAFYGISVLFYSENITGATISHVAGGYLYYQISGVYYRIPYANGVVAEGAKEAKLSSVTFSTSWYAPEVVSAGGAEYIIGTLSSSDYYDYVFAVKIVSEEDEKKLVPETDVKAFLEKTITDKDELAEVLDNLKDTEYGTFISGTGKYNDLYMWARSISDVSSDAQKTIDEYMTKTYGSETDSEVSATEGCGSAMGIGVTAGLAVLAAAGAIIGRKRA